MNDNEVNKARRALLAGVGGISVAGISGCFGGGSDNGSTPLAPPPDSPTKPPITEPPITDVPEEPTSPEPPEVNESIFPSDGTHPPRGIHASFVEDPYTSRTLTWFTDGHDEPQSFIRYTQDESLVDKWGSGQALPQNMEVSEPSETFGVEVRTHRVTLRALDPNRSLFYQVGSDIGGWSGIHTLKPIPEESWRFVHFGDHGTTPNAQKVHDELLTHPADLCLIAGDLSYADGNQPVWDTWFDQNEPYLASHVMLAAAGNHENKDGSFKSSAGAFKSRLSHPQPGISVTASNPGSTFYSFDVGRVHFLVSSAGAVIEDFSLPEELINMEVDLSKAAIRRLAGEIDFIVILQHYPIWTDQAGRSPANFTLVSLQEQILVRYGVDLLLVGHDHVYQRSAPMAYGFRNPIGYTQVMAGTGGVSVRLFDDNGPQRWSESEFVGIGFVTYDVAPGVIRGNFWGAGPVGLDDESRQIVNEDFEIRDSFEVRKRSLASIKSAAVMPRDPKILLKDYSMIAYHTKIRNHRDEHGC